MQLDEIQAGGGGAGGAVARLGLAVVSLGWRAAWIGRRALYATGLKDRTRLARPVVSVGNLVAGGTGKTPFVAWLAARLLEHGHHPGILARGYGAQAVAGALSDEGAVLDRLLEGRVPQREDGDRRRGAAALLAAHPEVDVLLLDDGFQHWPIERDLDIVLIDATRPFGHGRLLPRGLLREPRSALGRAGVLVITRTERVPDTDALEAELARSSDAPVVLTRTRPSFLAVGDGREPLETLRGRPVGVACGIGNPGAFIRMLEEDLGAKVVFRRILPDHAAPDAATWQDILADARAAGSERVVITRKDAVKHASLPDDVAVLEIGLEVTRGEEALDEALGAVLR